MQKLSLEEKVYRKKVGKPRKFIGSIVGAVFSKLVKKYNYKSVYKVDLKKYNGKPIMFLCNHTSLIDYMFVCAELKKYYPCLVCGYNNIIHKARFKMMMYLDVIGKQLYQPDLSAVKCIMRAVKANRSICLYPEGIQSTSGSTHPINPATTKLLKKLCIPIVLVKGYGAYLTRPRFSAEPRIGEITYVIEELLSSQQIMQMTEDDIYKVILEKFSYNEFEYNKEKRIKFIGKVPNASGIDKILYCCPKCKSEFNLKISGEHIICDKCGNDIVVNEYYDLVGVNDSVTPDNIDSWYKWQRALVCQQIEQDDFMLETDCILKTADKYVLHDNPLMAVGEGKVKLNSKGISYLGTCNGKEVEFFFDIERLPSIPFGPGVDFDVRYKDDFYCFEPKQNKNQVVKWMLCCEELHNKIDSKWAEASNNAYRLNK
ncbi:MAG: hypothetical protein RR248_01575 [Clostridia bacterium]